eukprot:6533293-Prymnesium_polylepis.2
MCGAHLGHHSRDGRQVREEREALHHGQRDAGGQQRDERVDDLVSGHRCHLQWRAHTTGEAGGPSRGGGVAVQPWPGGSGVRQNGGGRARRHRIAWHGGQGTAAWHGGMARRHGTAAWHGGVARRRGMRHGAAAWHAAWHSFRAQWQWRARRGGYGGAADTAARRIRRRTSVGNEATSCWTSSFLSSSQWCALVTMKLM